MAPRFPKCLKIADQIGDRRVDKVLHAIFSREEKAYRDDERTYGQMIEELEVRVEERHGLIAELKKLLGDSVVDEGLAYLRVAEQEDLAEIGRLIRMKHNAALKAAIMIGLSSSSMASFGKVCAR